MNIQKFLNNYRKDFSEQTVLTKNSTFFIKNYDNSSGVQAESTYLNYCPLIPHTLMLTKENYQEKPFSTSPLPSFPSTNLKISSLKASLAHISKAEVLTDALVDLIKLINHREAIVDSISQIINFFRSKSSLPSALKAIKAPSTALPSTNESRKFVENEDIPLQLLNFALNYYKVNISQSIF